MKQLELDGKKFGRLQVINKGDIKNKHLYWVCQCDCGNICEVMGKKIKGNF
jgi:hypothetical protein